VASPLQLRSDGLWAHVRFTPRAIELLRNREKQYTSATWLFDSPDRVSGEVLPIQLESVALTNTPFIDGLKPITLAEGSDTAWIHVAREGEWKGHPSGAFSLSRDLMQKAVTVAAAQKTPLHVDYEHSHLRDPLAPAAGWVELSRRVALAKGTTMDGAEILAQIAALVGVEDPADTAAIVAAVESVCDLSDAQSGKASEEAPAEMSAPEPVANSSTPMGTEDAPGAAPEAEQALQLLMDATGLDAAAVLAALKEKGAALAELLKPAPNGSPAGDGVPVANATTVANTRANPVVLQIALSRLASAEKQLADYKKLECSRAVDDAISGGRVMPGDREAFEKLFATDKELFAQLTKSQLVPMSREVSQASPDDTAAELTDKELAVYRNFKACGWSDSKARKEIFAKRSK
jgi:phage I-like protein